VENHSYEVINITFKTENEHVNNMKVDVLSDETLKALGKYIVESGIVEVPESLLKYIDYKAIGDDFKFEYIEVAKGVLLKYS
jgi:hypothetical protein